MDHDRSSGEGVGAQEYTLIKMKLLQLPDRLAKSHLPLPFPSYSHSMAVAGWQGGGRETRLPRGGNAAPRDDVRADQLLASTRYGVSSTNLFHPHLSFDPSSVI